MESKSQIIFMDCHFLLFMRHQSKKVILTFHFLHFHLDNIHYIHFYFYNFPPVLILNSDANKNTLDIFYECSVSPLSLCLCVCVSCSVFCYPFYPLFSLLIYLFFCLVFHYFSFYSLLGQGVTLYSKLVSNSYP